MAEDRSFVSRSYSDFAIEFGEYLAFAAESYLAVQNDLWTAEEHGTSEQVERLEESRADHLKGLRSAIYEFRKRAERAKASVSSEIGKPDLSVQVTPEFAAEAIAELERAHFGDAEKRTGIYAQFAEKKQPVNQCDGCARGLPVRSRDFGREIHYDHESGQSVMACTKHLYQQSSDKSNSPEAICRSVADKFREFPMAMRAAGECADRIKDAGRSATAAGDKHSEECLGKPARYWYDAFQIAEGLRADAERRVGERDVQIASLTAAINAMNNAAPSATRQPEAVGIINPTTGYGVANGANACVPNVDDMTVQELQALQARVMLLLQHRICGDPSGGFIVGGSEGGKAGG